MWLVRKNMDGCERLQDRESITERRRNTCNGTLRSGQGSGSLAFEKAERGATKC